MTDREIIYQWVLAHFEEKELARLFGDGHEEMNAVIGFIYVDSSCGMTLNVEFGGVADGELFKPLFRPAEFKQRFFVRYSLFGKKEMRLLSEQEKIEFNLPEHPEMLKIYNDDKEKAKMRSLLWLDQVRAPGFPDDIKCLVYDEKTEYGEWVWARLMHQYAENRFICRLLNEPFKEFGVHKGDTIAVLAVIQENETSCICTGKAESIGKLRVEKIVT